MGIRRRNRLMIFNTEPSPLLNLGSQKYCSFGSISDPDLWVQSRSVRAIAGVGQQVLQGPEQVLGLC